MGVTFGESDGHPYRIPIDKWVTKILKRFECMDKMDVIFKLATET